ncbi:hypothetical protein FSS13T_06990 [Flavobacterium saliperosum S13]|nr:hypothetical protein FSS13T_06990 [Flavobacterium saliperosum S13]
MLQGSWVAYKTTLKSDKTSQNINYNYLKFTFKGNNLYINIDPTVEVSQTPIPFTMKGKLAKTSRVSDSGYIIEKISQDSLTVSDSFESGAKRYHFINQDNARKENIMKYEGQDVIVASTYCTPTQSTNIYEPINKILKGRIKGNLIIEGTLKIHIKEKKIETTIISENLENNKTLNKISESLNDTFEFWNLTHFDKFKTVEIPFKIIGQNINNFETLRIQFL